MKRRISMSEQASLVSATVLTISTNTEYPFDGSTRGPFGFVA